MKNNNKEVLGIIGGVGPQTTAKVYLAVVESIRKQGATTYPPIAIWNLPFPFIVEEEAIAQGINVHKMLPFLIEGAQILEKSGATFGILPCNTLHKYIEDIRKSVNIPFLSILEETTIYLKSQQIKKVAILATQTTVNDRLYDDILQKENIETLYPTQEEQNMIDNLILTLIEGETSSINNDTLIKICESLEKQGAEAILLACTDLQLVKMFASVAIPIIDTTQLLIEVSVRKLKQ